MNLLTGAIASLLLVPIFVVVGIFLGLLFRGIDRKLGARMQARVGPPVRQPFIDLRKLLMKENMVPRHAIGWVFNSAPVIALVSALLLLLYLPLFGFAPLLEGYGDLILIMYLLMVPAIALAIGGFSSGSTYASVGAQRELVLMMSYEFALAVVTVTIAFIVSLANPLLNAFSLATLAALPVWELAGPIGAIGLVLLLLALMLVMPAELGRIPGDIAEAKTEIADGVLVEYSGRNLALFNLAQDVRTIAFAALVVAFFFPYNIAPHFITLEGSAGMIANAAFFLIKLFIVVFAGSIFVHVAVARFRVDQAAKTYWGPVLGIALVGMALAIFGAMMVI
ncbi:MAG: NADH-quinone oxidoreductase subunit H [Candidatus Diapherotrites archaeon]|nr:NADH-quinone oxidoreductase subunit H [Candidatus Diapherotrites archaeon]